MSLNTLPLRGIGRLSNVFRRSRVCSYFSTIEEFIPFDTLVSRRRIEAQRSLLVEVLGVKSASDLYQVCSEYGAIKNMFHYKTKSGNGIKEMMLIEYEDVLSLRKAMFNTLCPSDGSDIPVHSPLVWLTANKKTKASSSFSPSKDLEVSPPPVVSEVESSDIDLFKSLFSCSSISSQIQTLYDFQNLTEIGWRLRFFTCRQIEVALSGLFPTASVLPFGSSVNTFGRRDCDLDMILELTDTAVQKDGQRLSFQTKKSRAAANPRITMQRHMEVISDLVENFIPGCSRVRKILGARIPIIKYNHDFTGIECDLSMSNRSGFYMSEMLYVYGSMDPRVRPLVFTIRCWAKDRHITSPFAGRWITNFSLTLLVLFYLMRTSPPVVPPLQTLISLAGSSDRRETNGIDCTFLRDLRTLSPSENTDSLETLLKGFFEFYYNFDFKERGLSVVNGRDFVKPEHKALYIQNPLERDLNVSRNVTYEELERLKFELSKGLCFLEDQAESSREINKQPWGVLCLCSNSTHPVAVTSGKLAIDWTSFFSETSETDESTNNTKSLKSRSANTRVAKSTSESRTTERLLDPKDLNNLVLTFKGRVGNKNKRKGNKKDKKMDFTYKW